MMISRFLPEGEHFTFDEILFLEILMYTSEETPFISILDAQGMSIRQLIDSIDQDLLVDDKIYRGYLTGMEWKRILNVMKSRDRLLDVVIAGTHMDEDYGGGGGLAAVMISEKNNEAVVAFRGTATREWVDDFSGAIRADTLQQLNALEWYRSVYRKYHLNKYYITLTGHSKGGNKAKYITILDDTPDRCISIDGQGFSDAFFEAYGERILQRKDRIENHSIDYDSINALMTEIGKEYFYTGFAYGKLGYIETHSMGKFFKWEQDGEYTIHISSLGQSPEMLSLKHFFNSYIRSIATEQDKNEMARCLGLIVQKSNEINDARKNAEERSIRAGLVGKAEKQDTGKEQAKQNAEFINFVCDLIADPVYTDKVAFLIAFLIRYQRLHPEFIENLKDVPERFGMEEMGKYADYLDSVLNWKELDRVITLTDFLSEHLPKGIIRQLRTKLNKSLNLDLTREQFSYLLSIISGVRQYVNSLVIYENPSGELIEAGFMQAEVPEAEANKESAEEGKTDEITESGENAGQKTEEILNILVLAGGFSAERNISLLTGYRIATTLRSMGHHVIFMDSYMGCTAEENILTHAFEHVEELSACSFVSVDVMPDLWTVQRRRPGTDPAIIGPNVLRLCKKADLVFVGLHNAIGEYGKLQGTLELLGIPYTGDDYEATALAMNKDLTKRLLRFAGFDTPDWAVMKDTDQEEKSAVGELPENLSFPVIVKPCCGGSGIGVSFAWNRESYQSALKDAYRWEKKALVEQFLPGREFSVSILEGKVLPPAEIYVPSGIYNYETRFTSRSASFRCPVPEEEIRNELCEKTEAAAKELGITAYCRMDFRMAEDGRLMILECDTLPDMTEKGLLEAEIKAAGLSFEELCRILMKQARRKK